MNKKALRKDLERVLSKSIIDALNKRNAIAGEKIKKKVEEVSKTIAKKFYRALKDLDNKKTTVVKSIEKTAAKGKKAPVRKTKTATVKKAKK
jgi:hypothetical protein